MATSRKPLNFQMDDAIEAVVSKAKVLLPKGEPRLPIGARVTKSVYRRAKIQAAMEDAKLQDWVEGAILDKLAKTEHDTHS